MWKPNVYQYFRQERISYGFPVNEAVRAELDRLRSARVFVIATRSLNRRTRLVASLVQALGGRFAGLFDQVEPHVPRTTAVAAAAAARQAGADLLISIGGGSAIDTGKMVQIGYAREYDVERKWRETRILQIAPISTNLILSYIGEHVLGMPRSY